MMRLLHAAAAAGGAAAASLLIPDWVKLLDLQVVNVTPRYAKLRDSQFHVMGWENIELISDR